MDFNYSNKSIELQESLLKFFDEHIYPNEIDYDKAIEESGDPLHIPVVLEDLKEEAKKIVKLIKELNLKIQAQIQDDKVRVSGKKINDLQEVITFLKSENHGLPLNYTNMRS